MSRRPTVGNHILLPPAPDPRGTWVPSTRDEYMALFDNYGGTDGGQVVEWEPNPGQVLLELLTDVSDEEIPGGPMPLAVSVEAAFWRFQPGEDLVRAMPCESIATGVVCLEPAAAWNGQFVCTWHEAFEKVIYDRGVA